jgi:hypothetical protein
MGFESIDYEFEADVLSEPICRANGATFLAMRSPATLRQLDMAPPALRLLHFSRQKRWRPPVAAGDRLVCL